MVLISSVYAAILTMSEVRILDSVITATETAERLTGISLPIRTASRLVLWTKSPRKLSFIISSIILPHH